jgi:hypothetical protein
MDLDSEKNLEMAEVLLSALNPAARATLWLKVVKYQKEISLPSSQKKCVHFLAFKIDQKVPTLLIFVGKM